MHVLKNGLADDLWDILSTRMVATVDYLTHRNPILHVTTRDISVTISIIYAKKDERDPNGRNIIQNVS